MNETLAACASLTCENYDQFKIESFKVLSPVQNYIKVIMQLESDIYAIEKEEIGFDVIKLDFDERLHTFVSRTLGSFNNQPSLALKQQN